MFRRAKQGRKEVEKLKRISERTPKLMNGEGFSSYFGHKKKRQAY